MERPTGLGIPWLRAPRHIACCRCRHRKKKCDKRRPVCGECSKAGEACVPLMPKKFNASQQPSARYIQLLEEHIANLETRLRTSNPSIVTDHLASKLSVEEVINDDQPDSGAMVDAGPSSPLLLTRPPEISVDSGWILDTLDDITGTQSDHAIGMTNADSPQILNWQLSTDVIDVTTDSPSSEALDLPTLEDQHDTMLNGLMCINMTSEKLAESYLAQGIASRYVAEYFASAHPMWPFLHHKQWDNCWAYWEEHAGEQHTANWRAFFVEMVLSVGALLVNESNPSLEHLSSSKSAHQRAIARYSLCSSQDTSPTIKTQSSLLLTVHAMHLGSVTELFCRASEAIENCAISTLVHCKYKQDGRMAADADAEEVIHQMTRRTCVVIDILLSNSMDHTVCFDGISAENEDLGDDETKTISAEELRLSHPQSQNPPSPLEIALEEHMFWLRRIQYRILHVTSALGQEAKEQGHPVPNLWRSSPRYELERWVREIPTTNASPQRGRRFLSATWLTKLANYTVISLFPNPLLAVRGGDSRHLVKAACSVLTTFRRLRVKDGTTCYTWTALLHQFQAAVTVMFCLWATPTHQQAEFYDRRVICESLFAGLATLVDFANKWKLARVFRETFELLTECLPVAEFGDPAQQWTISPARSEELRTLTNEIEGLKAQPKVVSMLRTMLRGPRPAFTTLSISETQWIQYEHNDDQRGS